MTKLLKRISDEWAGLLSLAGAFAAGMIVLAFVGGWSSLPAEVQETRDRIERVEEAIVRMDLLICLHFAAHSEAPAETCVTP